MKIYVTHATGYDFKSELYAPLKTLDQSKYVFIFPHKDDTFINSKEIIKQSDLVLAEVSQPSTGQGIELGWADGCEAPIICLYKNGSKISRSLSAVCDTFVAYDSTEQMLQQLEAILENKS